MTSASRVPSYSICNPARALVCSFDNHRDPPSFPTRRSSDLRSPGRSISCCTTRTSSRVCARTSAQARSEEHTSELQSPYEIVCLLLLEKKIPSLEVTKEATKQVCD